MKPLALLSIVLLCAIAIAHGRERSGWSDNRGETDGRTRDGKRGDTDGRTRDGKRGDTDGRTWDGKRGDTDGRTWDKRGDETMQPKEWFSSTIDDDMGNATTTTSTSTTTGNKTYSGWKKQ